MKVIIVWKNVLKVAILLVLGLLVLLTFNGLGNSIIAAIMGAIVSQIGITLWPIFDIK